MPDAARDIVAERLLGGRYRLVRGLAHGGMAQVWEARDEVLDRTVAVKVLHPHLAGDEALVARFRQEAIAAARLGHPNIVSIYDTGVDQGFPFIVMELVWGRPLRQLLDDSGALPIERAVDIGAQVASALDYAHRSGIVHRDVKPGNILLCEDGRAKVADFGIAKALAGSDLTQTGMVLGTARYLSPEQVNGLPLDGRSDVYALGVVIYEMVCGQAPFAGDTDMTIALSRLQHDPPSLLERRPGIPAALQVVATRALARSPQDRYASAAELRAALLAVPLHETGAVNDPEVAPGLAAHGGRGAGPAWVPAPPPADDTPVGGVSVRPLHRRRRSSARARFLTLAGLLLVAGGVIYAAALLGSGVGTQGGTSHGGVASPARAPLTVAEVKAFDPPPGDGQEHDSDLPKLTDGDPSTVWTTEHYDTRRFGGIKPGVGVVLRLDGPHKLRRLTIRAPTHGWSVQVFLASAPAPVLSGWGQPVSKANGIPGDTTIDLGGHQDAALLLWITDLGDANQVSIGELKVSA
ncbi:MAG TPA: protein kinase [Acidimicrobiales bacterium]|nr:protein kinase [Acidimicrobiales bacterium]